MHEGVPKSERIELALPHDVFYDVEGIAGDNIFCNSKTGRCYLTFNFNLQAGENLLVLKKKTREEFKESIFDIIKIEGNHYGQDEFNVDLSDGTINYHFNNGEKMYKLSLVKSANRNTNTDTYTWNKYGEKQNKRENRIPGIYIMANDGKIGSINDALFTELYAAKGTTYTKLWVSSTAAKVEITITTTAPQELDVDTTFKPPTREMNDYFLKIDTGLDFKGEFYHDMNGYLVSKRGIGQRLDYEWTYKPEDKINANTYPACSFFYAHSGNQKVYIYLFSSLYFWIVQPELLFMITASSLTLIDFAAMITKEWERDISIKLKILSATSCPLWKRINSLKESGREALMMLSSDTTRKIRGQLLLCFSSLFKTSSNILSSHSTRMSSS